MFSCFSVFPIFLLFSFHHLLLLIISTHFLNFEFACRIFSKGKRSDRLSGRCQSVFRSIFFVSSHCQSTRPYCYTASGMSFEHSSKIFHVFVCVCWCVVGVMCLILFGFNARYLGLCIILYTHINV